MRSPHRQHVKSGSVPGRTLASREVEVRNHSINPERSRDDDVYARYYERT
jgi:hypothetical protein